MLGGTTVNVREGIYIWQVTNTRTQKALLTT